MKILLIRPPFARNLRNDVYETYPLGLMYVAAMLRARGHEVLIYHDDVSNPSPIPRGQVHLGRMTYDHIDFATYRPLLDCLEQFAPEAAGVGYCTVDAEGAHGIAVELRRRGIRSVAGGIHPSLMPEQEMQWFDSVVVGEGDQPEAAAAFEDAATKVLRMPPKEDLDSLLPAREAVLGGGRYSPFLRGMVQTQRGCPYGCGYCAAPSVFGRQVRARDPGRVREEVEGLGVREGRIIDDAFGALRRQGIALCRELRKTQYFWVCDMALQNLDEEMADALSAAHCVRVNIGIESATPRWQKLSGKRVRPGRPEEVLRLCRAAGMGVVYYFMLGFPGETYDELRRTLAYARHLRDLGASPCISIVCPYPGTALWDLAEASIGRRSWSDFVHQSSTMGLADCTEDEWAAVLEEANTLDV